MDPQRPRRWLLAPGDVATGVVGACLLLPLEWVALAGVDAPRAVAAVLLLVMGVAIGTTLAIAEVMIGGWRLGPLAAAFVRAVPSVAVTVPVALHLFDGAFAATLPGARFAPIWVPLGATIGLAGVLWIAAKLAAGRLRLLLVGGLLFATLALEYVNRTVQRTEYPDIHTAMMVAACLTGGVAVRLALHGFGPWQSRPRVLWAHALRALTLVVVVGVVWVARSGLQPADARMALATSGMHTRMLVRVARGIADLDRDGHSSLFGGSDCDDLDASRHPGVAEVLGNSIDENCDGVTGEEPAAQEIVAAKQERRQQMVQWRDDPAVEAELARVARMNVVLVAIDTLRADVLADTPTNRAEFPSLFELLDASRHFALTFAPAAGTDLSMSGVLTGQIDPFATPFPTLAEALHDSGRATYAVIPSEVIRYVGKAMLTRGLDAHERLVNDMYQRDVGTYATGGRTNELGFTLLDKHRAATPDKPFFLWLHYFDVHEHHEIKLANLRDLVGDVGELDRVARYRLMVRVVDGYIGQMIEGLRSRGIWDQTMIVLVSDHGEGLGEDPRLPDNHGRVVYNPLVHVPMAFRVPGFAPARIERAVSLLDVYPTLLELIGAPMPDGDGESLLPHLLPGAPSALVDRVRPVPLNETDQFGVVMWPHKLLVRREDQLVEIFDLSKDFGEQRNLAGGDPTLMQALMAAYGTLSPVEIDRSGKGRRARDRVAKANAEDDE